MILSFLMAIIIASGTVDASPEQRPYGPRGVALEAFYSKAPELLLSGPAGTGKSRAALEKLHLCASKYAGMRGLVVRKTRASLTESGLVTFEEKVLPARSPVKSGPQRRYRQSYSYHNGSEIVVGGMDDPTRVMSTEYDLIVPLEATELTEEDWDNLTTRLRNFVMPFQQLIADCNPASPQHWLKLRADRGVTQLLSSRHEDNPVLFDHGQWTEKGKTYIATLDNLTGARKLRLRHGIWAMAEGMVYADVWDTRVHQIYRNDPRYGLQNGIPQDWQRYWVVDFGFTNPFVWQAWAEDHDGRLYRYREIYRTKTLVEDHAVEILNATKGDPKPVAIICDHDAEDRATLERHLGMTTIAAYKGVSDGIQGVSSRLRVAKDGKARLFYLRDSLVDRDASLAEAKKPTCTEEEYESYVWNAEKDLPIKKDDHGLDATRYLVGYVDITGSGGVFV